MAHSSEFEIISSLTRPGTSVDAAIRELLVLTSAAVAAASDTTHKRGGPLSLHLNNVWSALLEDVVTDTAPAQQGSLVEFLRALRRQKVIDPVTDQQLLYTLAADYTVPVWTGLPLFGISVRDGWNFDASSCTPNEEACYYNKVAFLAQLSNLPENNVQDPEVEPLPYDFSLYALWDFRDVFEQDPESDYARSILLRAASLWMIHCAEKLRANVQARRCFVHQATGSNPAQAGQRFNSDNDWSGFNSVRWSIWVEGLKHIDEMEREDVKELVGKALIAIERVESST